MLTVLMAAWNGAPTPARLREAGGALAAPGDGGPLPIVDDGSIRAPMAQRRHAFHAGLPP